MPRIPLGTLIDTAIQWLTVHADGLFDVVSAALLFVVNVVYGVLAAPPDLVLVAILSLLAAWSTRRVLSAVLTAAAFLLVLGIDLWTETLQTLAVVFVAALAAVLFGAPLGVLGAKSERVSAVLRPVLDFMQTLPVFVYLVPAVFFFGIGVVPGIVSTVVFSIPPAVRLTELGIRQVDGETVEAAHAFGARPRQVLREVEIPLAFPSIMAGINQVIMLALSMVVVAGLVGADGLGAVVVEGVTQLSIGAAFEGGIAVVILAIYLDRVTGAAGRTTRRSPRRWTARIRSRRTSTTPDEQRAEPARPAAEPSTESIA